MYAEPQPNVPYTLSKHRLHVRQAWFSVDAYVSSLLSKNLIKYSVYIDCTLNVLHSFFKLNDAIAESF